MRFLIEEMAMKKMKRAQNLSKNEMKTVQGGGIFDLYWVPVFGPIWKESDRLDTELEKSRKKNRVNPTDRIMNKKSLNVMDGNYNRNK